MPRQNRRERFWITAKALARRAEGRMPESTAGMRESGVRMVREKAMDGFFNNLLVCLDQDGGTGRFILDMQRQMFFCAIR